MVKVNEAKNVEWNKAKQHQSKTYTNITHSKCTWKHMPRHTPNWHIHNCMKQEDTHWCTYRNRKRCADFFFFSTFNGFFCHYYYFFFFLYVCLPLSNSICGDESKKKSFSISSETFSPPFVLLRFDCLLKVWICSFSHNIFVTLFRPHYFALQMNWFWRYTVTNYYWSESKIMIWTRNKKLE